MRAVPITRLGGRDFLDVADIPEPEADPGQQLCDVSAAGGERRRHPQRLSPD